MRKAEFNFALGVGLAVLVALSGVGLVLRPSLVTLYRNLVPAKVEFSRGEVTVAGHRIEVEIASTDAARDRGLMYRSNLRPDAGMLFVFDKPDRQCMWMKNTQLALSVAFIDARGTVTNIEEMQPHTEDVHCSNPDATARYALEMPARWFDEHKLSAGARIDAMPGQID